MHIFGEMEDCKLFVRILTQPKNFNEENLSQLNIVYSNFFHLKVTNKHVPHVDKCKKEGSVFLYLLQIHIYLLEKVYFSGNTSEIIDPGCYSRSDF